MSVNLLTLDYYPISFRTHISICTPVWEFWRTTKSKLLLLLLLLLLLKSAQGRKSLMHSNLRWLISIAFTTYATCHFCFFSFIHSFIHSFIRSYNQSLIQPTGTKNLMIHTNLRWLISIALSTYTTCQSCLFLQILHLLQHGTLHSHLTFLIRLKITKTQIVINMVKIIAPTIKYSPSVNDFQTSVNEYSHTI